MDEADVAPVVRRPEPVLLGLVGVGGVLDVLQPRTSLITGSRLEQEMRDQFLPELEAKTLSGPEARITGPLSVWCSSGKKLAYWWPPV